MHHVWNSMKILFLGHESWSVRFTEWLSFTHSVTNIDRLQKHTELKSRCIKNQVVRAMFEPRTSEARMNRSAVTPNWSGFFFCYAGLFAYKIAIWEKGNALIGGLQFYEGFHVCQAVFVPSDGLETRPRTAAVTFGERNAVNRKKRNWQAELYAVTYRTTRRFNARNSHFKN